MVVPVRNLWLTLCFSFESVMVVTSLYDILSCRDNPSCVLSLSSLPPIKVHTSAKRWIFTTTNVAKRAFAIAHTTSRLILAAEKFIVVYKILGYCTNIYICILIGKEPCSDKLTPFFNPGRWDLDASDLHISTLQ